MGQNCSSVISVRGRDKELHRKNSPDPIMYDLMRKALLVTSPHALESSDNGQYQLLYKNQLKTCHWTSINISSPTAAESGALSSYPTRLVKRQRSKEKGPQAQGRHIYAIRYPKDTKDLFLTEQSISFTPPVLKQEQYPSLTLSPLSNSKAVAPIVKGKNIFVAASMLSPPNQKVSNWVTVSEEHGIYVADIGLTTKQCNELVSITEQVCQGQFSEYTYAKQTLACQDYDPLAKASFGPVHTTVHAISEKFSASKQCFLDKREPHIVKYDVTKRERQKLVMHTDKSEFSFLIALSNGCGVDYEGGGTYFECLDATVHIQRGHALVFPGKLRHCGQKITGGLRYLLVGFLVEEKTDDDDISTVGEDVTTEDDISNGENKGTNS